jgi:glyoxylase-like metal-dependent hydrolase (beta-lactamase superfamily II)
MTNWRRISQAVAAVAYCFSLTGTAFAATGDPVDAFNAEAETAKIVVHTLRDHYSVLEGSGGNIGVLATPHEVVLIDAGIAVSQPQISKALARISSAPVKYVINTHWHWDHTDGNAWAHKGGATIIAHRNTLKHLLESTYVEEWQHTFLPAAPAVLPDVLIDGRTSLHIGGTTLELNYYGPAHTDSDISVYLPEANILQTGDTWFNGYYPMIDYATGGSIEGMIRAANINLSLSNENTIVVPGHGPVGNRSDLVRYRDMLVTVRDNVARLKGRGMSLPEVIAAKPTAAFDAQWSAEIVSPAVFTRLVYRGVGVTSARADFDLPAIAAPASQDAARLVVGVPLPEALARGLAVIPYRTDNLRIVPVYGPGGLGVIPRIGHLHVTLDDAPWHWVDASGEPIIIQFLPPGPHHVLIQLADPTHHVIDSATVTFVIPNR